MPPDLPVEPLDGVVRANVPPMLAGISQYAGVSAKPSRTILAASLGFIDSALAAEASRYSMAWMALSMAATRGLFDLGTLARTLR